MVGMDCHGDLDRVTGLEGQDPDQFAIIEVKKLVRLASGVTFRALKKEGYVQPFVVVASSNERINGVGFRLR